MNNFLNPFGKLCICTIVNFFIVSFILIVSFYLIRRFNGINLKNIETFQIARTGTNPVIKINMDKIIKPLNKISNSLQNIDAKLDYVNGFKTIKTKGKGNKGREVKRSSYPYGKGTPVEEKEDS